MEKLQAARDNEKAREQDLVRTRKHQKQELLKLGAGDSKSHLRARSDFVLTIFAIEASRDRQKYLADLMGETVKKAHQPQLFPEVDDDIPVKEWDENNVFEALRGKASDDEDDDPDQQDLPVGDVKGKERNSEERARKDGYVGDGPQNPALQADIKDLDLPADIGLALQAAEIHTIGALIKVEEEDKLESIEGITGPKAKSIRKSLKTWQKAQAKAEVAVG